MPRPRKPSSGEPKTRSRHGCTQCKQRKIKCGEQKPTCINCEKTSQPCDYSIKLNWDGRTKRKGGQQNHMTIDNTGRKTPTEGSSADTTAAGTSYKPALPPTKTASQVPARRLDPSPSFLSRSRVRPQSSDVLSSLSKCARLKDEATPYPSPADSTLDDNFQPSAKRSSFMALQHYGEMPPPSQLSPRNSIGGTLHRDNGYKRTRLSPSIAFAGQYQGFANGGMGNKGSSGCISSFQASPHASMAHPYSPPAGARVPPSPVTSSVGSDESQTPKSRPSPLPQPDRRMSIESLISGSYTTATTGDAAFSNYMSLPSQSSTPKSYYGIDPGYPDFDTPFNRDASALNDANPSLNACPRSMGSQQGAERNFGPGPYAAFYKQPIKVRIPEEFEPLPSILFKQPMNLLYFHHFISHTARILVPHDCSGNPFRKILPKMALKDDNLLRLLLAYSASHRARLMGYSEPRTRISGYVDGMFTTLCEALKNPRQQISNTTFATAIMLASLEIISPNPFGTNIPIPWDTHLAMAGSIISSRGIRAQTVDRNDDESYFLTRWFAYLDVLGSLSGGRKSLPLFGGDFWADDPQNPDQAHRIDCFFGFTDRCVRILASIAALARICDEERAAHRRRKTTDLWKPSQSSQDKAKVLRADVMGSMQQPYQGCHHTRHRRGSTPSPTHSPSPCKNHNSDASSMTHALELTTTNESYHWAGLIYLSRRCLGLPRSDPQLQTYIHVIVTGLSKIALGGTAEACMLFPIFVAGCEALDPEHRKRLRDRVRNVESTGLTQARKAREVMESVWKAEDAGDGEGKGAAVGWEGMVGDGFIVC